MLDELKDIYKDNINWLTFAELKNGVIITVSGVFLGIINTCIKNNYIKSCFFILCVITILISGMSFIPFLNNSKLIKNIAKKHYIKCGNKNCKDSENIIFYIAVFLSTMEIYISSLKEILIGSNTYELTGLEKNYVTQIYQISTIASIKYYFFKCACYVFAIMLFLFILITIIG